ncbi:MAG: hypothetical protein OXI10_15100 [Gammaproteobacteria bacterium]|nr:hypothetical protein [Gammaproteobacteria bacterium]
MSSFRQTRQGEWTYLGFKVSRDKGSHFTYRTQVCRPDGAPGCRTVTLSASSLSELKWQIDRAVAEGSVPPGMDGPDG